MSSPAQLIIAVVSGTVKQVSLDHFSPDSEDLQRTCSSEQVLGKQINPEMAPVLRNEKETRRGRDKQRGSTVSYEAP